MAVMLGMSAKTRSKLKKQRPLKQKIWNSLRCARTRARQCHRGARPGLQAEPQRFRA
jgi:hypothetical protein